MDVISKLEFTIDDVYKDRSIMLTNHFSFLLSGHPIGLIFWPSDWSYFLDTRLVLLSGHPIGLPLRTPDLSYYLGTRLILLSGDRIGLTF
ncbi:hypothetical protein CDAR_244881 [Caerostris darwini]|uniref:Uncharacterized protein n=1 Tax=Caerostris darwini TaxID=1538125 RepID=A0AAV4RAD2_9ARAC|nr:hypothetical protein CDAR_244881 [Caerostris darwini]